MQEIFFNTDDGVNLQGILYQAQNTDKIIISVHGMTSNCLKKRESIISENANKNGISYFAFSNRGHDLVNYISKNINGKKIKELCGTTYEDVLDGYYDIVAAIKEMKKIGYTQIYIQGHSLGCTKTVYTYNRLKKENDDILKNIKGIILLSLVDIPGLLKRFLSDRFDEMLEIAKNKDKLEIMPTESFIHPISVKSFLRYAKYNSDINFAQYNNKDYTYTELNNIGKPLFIRFGNNNEMIEQSADELVLMLNKKINNKNKDINYIDGANHSYNGKEEELSEQIMNFIKNN